MRRFLYVLVMSFASASSALGQVSQSDTQTLQAILAELRAVHSELRVQEARTQTIQILLYELQTQQAVINRATQRVDDARSKLSGVQEGERHVAADITRSEDVLRTTEDQTEKAGITANIERSKAELASLRSSEQDRLTNQQQAESELQRAQEAYDTIQNDLDQLMRNLERAEQQIPK